MLSALRILRVTTPTTRPSMSISGPPELPGLIALSVWIQVLNRPVTTQGYSSGIPR